MEKQGVSAEEQGRGLDWASVQGEQLTFIPDLNKAKHTSHSDSHNHGGCGQKGEDGARRTG